MSDYKPGTVAMVTYNGRRYKAMRTEFGQQSTSPDGCWYILGWGGGYNESKVSDITPLVCIEATREDADVLEGASTILDEHQVQYGRLGDDGVLISALALQRIAELAAAIREQTPEPEPPKRWTTWVDSDRFTWVKNTSNARLAARCSSQSEAEHIVDALNATEATHG